MNHACSMQIKTNLTMTSHNKIMQNLSVVNEENDLASDRKLLFTFIGQ